MISKSKYLAGLQCPKLLWFYYNAEDAIPERDAAQRAIFDQGHEIGALAKKMFPDGIEVGAGITELPETIRLTADVVKLRKPLFEAAFGGGGGYARVDVLLPVEGDSWDILEIKSGTALENVHIFDLAFQHQRLVNAGLKTRRCFLGDGNSHICALRRLKSNHSYENVDGQKRRFCCQAGAKRGAVRSRGVTGLSLPRSSPPLQSPPTTALATRAAFPR